PRARRKRATRSSAPSGSSASTPLLLSRKDETHGSGQVSWLVDRRTRPAFPSLGGTVACPGTRAPHTQWRDRAGFSPASLRPEPNTSASFLGHLLGHAIWTRGLSPIGALSTSTSQP